jgi:hypothetical protein
MFQPAPIAVVFFSVPISTSVCKYLSWIASVPAADRYDFGGQQSARECEPPSRLTP